MTKLYKLRQDKNKQISLETEKTLNADNIVEIVEALKLKSSAWEEVFIIGITEENRHINMRGIVQIGIGMSENATFSLSNIIQVALLLNTTNLVLLHNHPNGDAKESDTDKKTREQLTNDLKSFHIQLMDSIIVSENEIYSATVDTVITGK